ncbi:MAG: hypothetical protein U5K69_10070 [Balneolaceae bacterium]|nr:hypothetical protein [Balneolaceae bacterium]
MNYIELLLFSIILTSILVSCSDNSSSINPPDDQEETKYEASLTPDELEIEVSRSVIEYTPIYVDYPIVSSVSYVLTVINKAGSTLDINSTGPIRFFGNMSTQIPGIHGIEN